MANREYVPPPVYGPTPPSPGQMEREADELVKRVQDAMDKRQAVEAVPTVDPWELLRESSGALAAVHSILFRGLVERIDAALKQHDEEKS